nr:universal stress protein [Nocardia brevicatena]
MCATGHPPILAGIDGSPRTLAALRWAAADAVRHRAPLRLVCAIGALGDSGPGIDPRQCDVDDCRQSGLEALEIARTAAVAESAPLTGLDISAELVNAPPIPVLRDRSATARLFVLGAPRFGIFGRRPPGPVSTALARHAACPVALVPESIGPMDGLVVVGVDGSPSSVHAVDIAFDEAAFRGVELVAVHTWSDFLRYSSLAEMQEEGEDALPKPGRIRRNVSRGSGATDRGRGPPRPATARGGRPRSTHRRRQPQERRFRGADARFGRAGHPAQGRGAGDHCRVDELTPGFPPDPERGLSPLQPALSTDHAQRMPRALGGRS